MISLNDKNYQRVFYPATIKGKKAVGHVETVLSFVIFIGFLAFLFAIFNPISSSQDAGVIDSVILKMEERLTTKVTTMSISLTGDGLIKVGTESCFSIEAIDDLKCNGEIVVKDRVGNNLKANLDGTSRFEIENYWALDPDDKFYTIYCSEEFIVDPTGSGCVSLDEVDNAGIGDYKLGIIVERNPWAESKIGSFVASYISDYESLRIQIVPQGNDFGFLVWDLNDLDGTPLFEAIRKTSQGVRVDSKTIGIDVLDAQGNTIQRTLNVQVW